jgi:hypothetical protein
MNSLLNTAEWSGRLSASGTACSAIHLYPTNQPQPAAATALRPRRQRGVSSSLSSVWCNAPAGGQLHSHAAHRGRSAPAKFVVPERGPVVTEPTSASRQSVCANRTKPMKASKSPCRPAIFAPVAGARLRLASVSAGNPSLARMLATCRADVAGLMYSSSAMALLLGSVALADRGACGAGVSSDAGAHIAVASWPHAAASRSWRGWSAAIS